MVELYKYDCTGKLIFCDYGLMSQIDSYKRRGYVVRRPRMVQPANRKPIPQRGQIHLTHRMPKKAGIVERFVDDVKHNVSIFKEVGKLFGAMFKTKNNKAREAKAYFDTRALAAA